MEPNCNELDIILYVEDELSESDMLRMECHFAQCAACRSILDNQRLIRIALTHATALPVPEEFTARVMAEIPSPFRAFLSTAREKILAAAAVIVLGVLSLGFYVVGSPAAEGAQTVAARFNRLFIDGVTLVVNGFRFALAFFRLLLNVGQFLLGEAYFLLSSMAKVLVATPGGRAVLAFAIVTFIGSLFLLAHRRSHRLAPQAEVLGE